MYNIFYVDWLAAQPQTTADFIKTHSLNLNTAHASQLSQIPYIGEATATNIVAARESEPFTSYEQLLQIHGLGEQALTNIRVFTYIE